MHITKLPPLNNGATWDYDKLMAEQTGPDALVVIQTQKNRECHVLLRLEHLEKFWLDYHAAFVLNRVRGNIAEILVGWSADVVEQHIIDSFA